MTRFTFVVLVDFAGARFTVVFFVVLLTADFFAVAIYALIYPNAYLHYPIVTRLMQDAYAILIAAMASKRNKQRTYARNRVLSRKGNEKLYESDGTYFLKLVLCIILGTLWLKFKAPITVGGLFFNGLPVGMLFGLLIVSRFEKFQYDRKIWYAILILVTIVSYFLPAGVVI